VLTAGPATVKSVYQIDLPRPRVVSEIRYEQNFIDYCKTIWEDLRQEVETSYRRASEAA
jgi:NitT/TauT family transport system ATP-binding protein